MAAPADDPASLQLARARARRRLIGAVVLLAIGVIVFPILFETRPRALSPDIPITVSRKDSGTVVTAPASSPRPPAPVAPPPDAGNEGEGASDARAAASGPAPAAAPSAPDAVAAATPPRTEARAEVKPEPKPAPPQVEAKPESRPEPKAEPKKEPKPEPKPEAKPKTEPPKTEPPKTAAAEASAPAKTGRYVVQVGAFTDALAVREARQKVEKLGLKTYTQEVDTPTGRRTRVRVGPFDTKAEADAAGAKLKGAGLPVYLLLL